jgi:WD40 repeat protein
MFVLVDSEEQDLQYSILDIERKLYEIGTSIKGLIENQTYLERELEAKKARQEACRRKKDDCSKVIVQSWVEMARRFQVPIAELSLAAILPPELLLHIFSFLSPADLCGGIARVNHKWYNLSLDNQMWRDICDQRGIELNSINPGKESNARQNYMEGFRRAQNWRKGKFRTTPLNGHKEIVWSVLFDGARIVSGSEDMTIKIWDAESAMCVNTFRGHKNGTICLSSYEHRIVSGSADGSIRIWDDESGQCLRTINTYSSVWSLQVLDNKLYAGCVDTSIRVFDVNTGQVLSTFRGHTAPVRSLQVARSLGETVVMSGSYDRTIKMWDLNGRCLNTIRAHTHKVNCLQFDGTTLVSGSHDTLVKVWDMSGQCLHTLQGHDNMIHCLQFKGNQLFTGSSDTTIRMWNLSTGEHINTIKNQSAVCSLQFDDTRLVSGFEDSSIQIYDFS